MQKKGEKPTEFFINNIEVSNETLVVNKDMKNDDLNDLEAPDEEMETLLEEQWDFSSNNVKIKTATPLTKE